MAELDVLKNLLLANVTGEKVLVPAPTIDIACTKLLKVQLNMVLPSDVSDCPNSEPMLASANRQRSTLHELFGFSSDASVRRSSVSFMVQVPNVSLPE